PGALRRVSEKLGVNRETVRYWVKNAPASRGGKRGLSDEEIGYVPPAEKEAMYYSENVSEKTLEIVG
ncbi:hypothetical protein, partial [Candidatus Aquicultor secundus]|uniref:hypothetical protein n=1 Tax=Candidatus Aquicultor secundus TaxID=1973895 RepID=UPI00257C8F91